MIKRKSLALVLFSALIFFSSFSFSQTKKNVLETIVIDPGHGGDFSGAKGSYSYEKNVTLAVSLKLGKAIEKEFPDTKIIFTRTTDANAGNKPNLTEDLRYRADLANQSGGDLFISIHCNSAPPKKHRKFVGYKTITVKKGKKRYPKKIRRYHYWTTPNPAEGTETYIWAISKSDDKVNSVSQNDDYYGEIDSTSNLTLPDPSDPTERARMLVYAQNYFRKSLTFADLVEKGFQKQGRTYRGGVKQRNDKGIWVLQATGMPSVLVEIGFISNKKEEDYINSKKGQDEIVDNIINAIKSYKEKLESRQITGQKKAF
jgi:N-acetylmuramoyl-L-alanine amidase